MPEMVTIPLKGKASIEIDLELINDAPVEVLRKLVLQGIKHYVNAGMTGEGYKTAGLEGKELATTQEAIVEKAQANFQAILENKFGERGLGKTAKVPGAVRTRAMQKARTIIKDALRREGYKMSEFKAKEITDFAKQWLEEHPETIAEAQAELEAVTEKAKTTITLPESFTAGKAKAKPKVAPKRPPAKAKKGEQRAHA